MQTCFRFENQSVGGKLRLVDGGTRENCNAGDFSKRRICLPSPSSPTFIFCDIIYNNLLQQIQTKSVTYEIKDKENINSRNVDKRE